MMTGNLCFDTAWPNRWGPLCGDRRHRCLPLSVVDFSDFFWVELPVDNLLSYPQVRQNE